MKRLLAILAVLLLGSLLISGPARAQLAVPALSGHVVDATGTLPATQHAQLESKLAAFEQAQGAQVVVLLVTTTQPEDIVSYANRVANTWKIGRKAVGDGLLLVVALQDRKIRIEVAKTLEGAIPDLAAKRIIDQAITPNFKQGDYAGGLDAGTDQIMALIKHEALPTPNQPEQNLLAGFNWTDLAIFLFFAVPLLATVARGVLGPRLGSLATGGLVGGIAMWITSSLLIAGIAGLASMLVALLTQTSRSVRGGGGFSHGGWGSGGGGTGGGGGFSSGGGGDFGGGGASGDW